jgi:hypothetical protein
VQHRQSQCANLRQKTTRASTGRPINFFGGKTDNRDVSIESEDEQPIEGDPRLRHAYPYFRMHLDEIAACVKGGCSVKSVWRAYATRAHDSFPGSYSSFLRYCIDHALVRRGAKGGTDASVQRGAVASPAQRPATIPQNSGALRGPRPVGSVLGRLNLYPPPLERPPGFIPSELKDD